jgi:selenocysteine-specific elongation factor
MTSSAGVVIGTAGHIDHGKTSLVRALTGIDTDRLAEEKKRGISIDLGFAHLTLPAGGRISFVDVPGHERFIKNMLAGAGGIHAVLLIVAADESVKPQTREHFDICRLLGIRNGMIVLTKVDLVSPEQIAVAIRDIKGLCAGSFLDRALIVQVSAVTGQGLPELKQQLSTLAQTLALRESSGLTRLPVDRSFVLKGFGTVVTGTMWGGGLHTGDSVQFHPGKSPARIRGLQVHGEPVEFATAGQRTAVNLSGIDHSEIRRGFVLTLQEGLETTSLVDVSVDWLDEAEIPKSRGQFLFHIGTAEVPAVLKVLNGGSLARLWMTEPILALPGDRFVLRRPSPAQTVAGGSIVDPFPPARLNRAKTIARLMALAQASPAKRVEILVEASGNGRRLPELVRLTGLPLDVIKSLVLANPKLVFVDAVQRAVSTAWIEQMRTRVLDWLRDFHAKNPSAEGAPIAQARLSLEANLAHAVFDGFPGVRVHGDIVALMSHKVQVSAADTQALSQVERAFQQAGFQPPPVSDVLRSTGADAKTARGLLEALVKSQKLVRVSEDLIFHADALAHIRKSLSLHKGRRFSVPEFKEWTQVSRKYAIPLLEYLDRQHITRREGDARIVL